MPRSLITHLSSLIIFLLMCLIFVSCQRSTTTNNFEIFGHLSGGDGREISLHELTPMGENPLGADKIDEHSNFHFTQPFNHASLYLLRTDDNQTVTLIVDTTGKIEITGNYNNLVSSLSVKGSKTSESIVELQKIVFANRMRVDSMSHLWDERKYEKNADAFKKIMDSTYQTNYAKQRELQIEIIKKNQRSLVPVYVLFQPYGSNKVFDETNEEDLFYMSEVIEDLYSVMPDNPHVNKLNEHFSQLKHQCEQIKQEQQRMKQMLQYKAEHHIPITISDMGTN